jgi:hypothetical protein
MRALLFKKHCTIAPTGDGILYFLSGLLSFGLIKHMYIKNVFTETYFEQKKLTVYVGLQP